MQQLNENSRESKYSMQWKIGVYQWTKCKIIDDDMRWILLVVFQENWKYKSKPQLISESDIKILRERKARKLFLDLLFKNSIDINI